jgi:hypothetical protein
MHTKLAHKQSRTNTSTPSVRFLIPLCQNYMDIGALKKLQIKKKNHIKKTLTHSCVSKQNQFGKKNLTNK